MFVVAITDVGGIEWIYGPFDTREQAQKWKDDACIHLGETARVKSVIHPNPK
ncbi:hypothetical protein LCGC14_1579510 [marine sediment metagenome]|uniref:SPOR domain-containing protein n=1 Tax=marine sediment metagenome TaxID=412755 RepID=A0A0F9LHJ4_9ZZZZ